MLRLFLCLTNKIWHNEQATLDFAATRDTGGGGLVVVALRCAKLQSDHHQLKNTQFLQDGCPSCRSINDV